MAEKEIALLQEQIAGLDENKFDLDAWKNHTVILLERIFGENSSKIKMINSLHYDYSSWNLRDTAATGKTKDKDPVRLQADEILKATIAELQNFGLPQKVSEKQKLWELLQDELTGKQVKEIETLIKSGNPENAKKISKILETIEKENLLKTMAKLLVQ
ncbi:MAG: hypothetical protein LBV47_03395 [Bacteroidales bacterium]|jgi:hypothetical protein|nr:hypothetical protein [Bacteroidales bacterium]